MINSNGTAKLLLDHMWQQYGLLDKIISDCKMQFALKVTQALLSKLGIKLSLSMAYHSQMDGAMEQIN